MKILIFAGVYTFFGIGHLVRMAYFAKFLLEHHNIEVVLTSNNPKKGLEIISKLRINVPIVHCINNHENVDIVIYDSPKINEGFIIYWSEKCNKLIALDYSHKEYQNVFNYIINIFEHSPENMKSYEGKYCTGLKYVLLNNTVKRKTELFFNERKILKVLVCFGGEDPNNFTKKVLEIGSHIPANCTIIVGPNYTHSINEHHLSKNANLIKSTENFGKLLIDHALIICGAGLTMMEAIYMGSLVISLPQNEYEKRFLKYIKTKVPIFNLDQVNTVFSILQQPKETEKIITQYRKLIDGKGKERLWCILKSLNAEK